MTFRARMLAETGAPQPRWLYLLRKPMDTAGITLALHAFLPLSWVNAATLAAGLYVAIGLVAWWGPRWRDRVWFGPGSITGDALYHWLPSQLVPVLAASRGVWITALLLGLVTLLWWQLEGAGYGPMRSS